MTAHLLMLMWIALSAAASPAAAVGMLVHAWSSDEFPAGHTRAPLRAFRAPG